jgi:hypothetical protein
MKGAMPMGPVRVPTAPQVRSVRGSGYTRTWDDLIWWTDGPKTRPNGQQTADARGREQLLFI